MNLGRCRLIVAVMPAVDVLVLVSTHVETACAPRPGVKVNKDLSAQRIPPPRSTASRMLRMSLKYCLKATSVATEAAPERTRKSMRLTN